MNGGDHVGVNGEPRGGVAVRLRPVTIGLGVLTAADHIIRASCAPAASPATADQPLTIHNIWRHH